MSKPTVIAHLSAVAMLLLGCAAAAQTRPTDLTITSVSMHRSACYGVCPVYTVEVLSTGEVRYDGQDNVKIKGHHTSHVPPDEFAFLVAAIGRVDFFSLHDQYMFAKDGCPRFWTDSPTVDFVITRGGQKKHASYYYGCRGLPIFQRIIWLSDTIDDVASSAQWVGRDLD